MQDIDGNRFIEQKYNLKENEFSNYLIQNNFKEKLASFASPEFLNMRSSIQQGVFLHDARKHIPESAIIQVIESIRNNLLEFVIALKEKYPNLKDENEYHNIKQKDVDSSVDKLISSSYFIQ
ncbi:MAG: hypothetical protein U9Q91_02735 [Candidatus Marinimicrobia bacterium]|nr:hypothetical protein [Candidatus Neomarinimicrobiota bacterium]